MPQLTIIDETAVYVYEVADNANLRKTLLKKDHSPYTAITKVLNCQGNGICATCGVWILKGAPKPQHWHDALAERWGYARLSCQVNIAGDMTVALDRDKLIWGKPRGNGFPGDHSTSA